MPWGKFAGRPVRQLPDTYLTWLLNLPRLYGWVLRMLLEEYRRRKRDRHEGEAA